MLPFAIPAYVLAFVFVGLLDFAGPVQTLLREWFGTGMRLPRVRSTGGVILVLVLVFIPTFICWHVRRSWLRARA